MKIKKIIKQFIKSKNKYLHFKDGKLVAITNGEVKVNKL